MTEANKQFDSIVVGLGKTGQSVVDYLIAQGQNIAAVDSRQQPNEVETLQQRYPKLPVYLGDFDETILNSCKQLVVSPGVSIREPAIQEALTAGVQLSSDIEIFCQLTKTPIIAVTGSNGKSTVVTLLTSMIQQSGHSVRLAGNIGIPVLTLLGEDEVDFYVLELSSFQLETLESLNATAALVLNVSPDHMDRYESLEDYASAKQKIYSGDGKMILNMDDPLVADMVNADKSPVCYGMLEPDDGDFGLREINGEIVLCHGLRELISASSLKLRGRHNISNALASLALGAAIDLPMASMLTALQNFSGLPHRCQWLTNIDGVDWYNDSKATNVGASCAAIEGMSVSGKLILIAGGDGKNADFKPLARVIQEHEVVSILLGKDATRIDRELAPDCQRHFATGIEAAVNTAARLGQAGDVVLLSPACASLDMFQDYEHRGDVFSKAVMALPGPAL